MAQALLGSPWIVVPVKPFGAGKSRLRLPEGARSELSRAFFDHVLDVAGSVLPAASIVVVSRDDAALAAARRAGARGLREGDGDGGGDSDLNDALAMGARFAADRGATAIVSLFADLPYLVVQDLEAMLDLFTGANVVLAPDEAGTGTNAMMMAPGQLPYRHGPNSLWRHLDAAREADIGFSIVRRTGLMRDIDTPDDLAAMELERSSSRRTQFHHGG